MSSVKKTRIAMYYLDHKGTLTKREQYVDLSTKALRQSILRKLTFESVLAVHCEHAMKHNTWQRELSERTDVAFKTMPKEKVVVVCKKHTIAEENLNSIVENKLWKTSMFGNFY